MMKTLLLYKGFSYSLVILHTEICKEFTSCELFEFLYFYNTLLHVYIKQTVTCAYYPSIQDSFFNVHREFLDIGRQAATQNYSCDFSVSSAILKGINYTF